jgi:DNA-binding CsgD family transcriptional regulator
MQAFNNADTFFKIHCTVDLAQLWYGACEVLESSLPLHSCSLLLQMSAASPRVAWHKVIAPEAPSYLPAPSLSVATPFLEKHPGISLYTYSGICRQDAQAQQRRYEQEAVPGCWTEFAHLAFWYDLRLAGVISVRRTASQAGFSQDEWQFFQNFHGAINAALYRLRALEKKAEPLQHQHRLYRRLTHAERRVALLVAEGHTSAQIAAQLERSRRTVEFQLGSIYRKLNLNSRAQLVRSLCST